MNNSQTIELMNIIGKLPKIDINALVSTILFLLNQLMFDPELIPNGLQLTVFGKDSNHMHTIPSPKFCAYFDSG